MGSQNDVVEPGKGMQSTSPANGTSLSMKQQIDQNSTAPAVSTTASAKSGVNKRPQEHEEVRTVVSTVPDGHQRDPSNIISLDEVCIASQLHHYAMNQLDGITTIRWCRASRLSCFSLYLVTGHAVMVMCAL